MLLKYKGHYPGRFLKSSYGCFETGQMTEKSKQIHQEQLVSRTTVCQLSREDRKMIIKTKPHQTPRKPKIQLF